MNKYYTVDGVEITEGMPVWCMFEYAEGSLYVERITEYREVLTYKNRAYADEFNARMHLVKALGERISEFEDYRNSELDKLSELLKVRGTNYES